MDEEKIYVPSSILRISLAAILVFEKELYFFSVKIY